MTVQDEREKFISDNGINIFRVSLKKAQMGAELGEYSSLSGQFSRVICVAQVIIMP